MTFKLPYKFYNILPDLHTEVPIQNKHSPPVLQDCSTPAGTFLRISYNRHSDFQKGVTGDGDQPLYSPALPPPPSRKPWASPALLSKFLKVRKSFSLPSLSLGFPLAFPWLSHRFPKDCKGIETAVDSPLNLHTLGTHTVCINTLVDLKALRPWLPRFPWLSWLPALLWLL